MKPLPNSRLAAGRANAGAMHAGGFRLGTSPVAPAEQFRIASATLDRETRCTADRFTFGALVSLRLDGGRSPIRAVRLLRLVQPGDSGDLLKRPAYTPLLRVTMKRRVTDGSAAATAGVEGRSLIR